MKIPDCECIKLQADKIIGGGTKAFPYSVGMQVEVCYIRCESENGEILYDDSIYLHSNFCPQCGKAYKEGE